jgi:3-oxoacyl-[acyl-carrier protein] reductase|tara:strand:+ start:141 stop:872 length:732 start_codon:yes stop_codon:yes gene_type:complete
MNLKNKKILITGATGGIGNSLVKKFYDLNAKIVATGTNDDKLKQLKKNYPSIIIKKFNLEKHNEIDDFIEFTFNELEGLDVLINNAGITKDNISLRLTEADWKKVIDINLSSTFLICKSSIKRMLKQKAGKIINITSIVGHTGNVGQANYAASKAGIVGFSKSLAIEYAKKNININCISPGFIQTEMTDKIQESYKDLLKSKIPKGTLGKPEDISNCVAFLASNLSDYITGETIHVNGGMYMS